MANIMSLKSLKNKTSRNGFDLSSKRNFSAKAGELLPIKTWEVLPGDSFNIDLKSFTRTQPLNTAAFARMREYYDFYFVPYSLLWNRAGTVLTQMYDNPQHALSIDPLMPNTLNGEMPYLTCEGIVRYLNSVATSGADDASYKSNYFGYNRAKCSAKLLEYLGYGNFSHYAEKSTNDINTRPLMANLQLNAFGLLAYQKIYADYYRDSQWEKISPSTFNVDYMTGHLSGSMALDTANAHFKEYYNLFDLRYCNWQKDLFHGVLPRQQYGSTALVDGSLSQLKLQNAQGTITPLDDIGNGISAPFTMDLQADVDDLKQTAASFSILALRQAEFLQKWKEITQSGNKDYKEQVEKHWNVSVGDGYSEMCTYLGGTASSLDINEVVNSNITEDNAADIAGKGTVVGSGSIRFNSEGRYGLIMCIYHCLPLLDYTTDLVSPVFTKVNATDYAIPEFDRVGMQGVPLIHMMNGQAKATIDSKLILGYAPRYIDYKTDVDSSVGAFKTSLKHWVISYDNQSLINQLGDVDVNNQPEPTTAPVNYTMFKVNPNCLDPLFAVGVDSSVDTDNFLCSSFFDVKVVRNLDVDGLPY